MNDNTGVVVFTAAIATGVAFVATNFAWMQAVHFASQACGG